MKKVFKTGVLLVALLTTTFNFAADVANTTEIKQEIKPLALLKKIEKGDQVIVKNRFGTSVLNWIASNTLYYEQSMNLRSLNDGQYSLEVVKDTMINITPFTITEGKVVFDLDKEYTLFKPMVRIKDNLIFVSQLSLQEKPLEIQLYFDTDDDGGWYYELLHAETVGSTKVIGKVLSLNAKLPGKYKLILSTEGRTFTEKFKL